MGKVDFNYLKGLVPLKEDKKRLKKSSNRFERKRELILQENSYDEITCPVLEGLIEVFYPECEIEFIKVRSPLGTTIIASWVLVKRKSLGDKKECEETYASIDLISHASDLYFYATLFLKGSWHTVFTDKLSIKGLKNSIEEMVINVFSKK